MLLDIVSHLGAGRSQRTPQNVCCTHTVGRAHAAVGLTTMVITVRAHLHALVSHGHYTTNDFPLDPIHSLPQSITAHTV